MRTKDIINPKKLLILALVFTVGFSSCKKFLDINQNPNNPESTTPDLLLPTVELAVGQIVGNSFQINGNFYAQYWTQNPNAPQYKIIDQYGQKGTNFDVSWRGIYRSILGNAQLIINNKTPNTEQTKGMAYILKAYGFQLATDGFGDVPLSQALQGVEFRSPKYEAQSLVYDSIFNYIDKGLALLKTTTSNNPGNQDVIFQGDLDKWAAFGNTLKLRAYLRISYKDQARAKAGIMAMYAGNPTFLNQDASIQYSSVGGNENPLYNEMVALNKTPNLVASSSAVDAFKASNDQRQFKYYDSLKNNSHIITSIPQGSYLANLNKTVSQPSVTVGANPNNPASAVVPVKLMSLSESKFLQAEAAARSLGGTGDVTTLFKAGIEASFVAVGLQVSDAVSYYNQATIPYGLTALTAAATPEAKTQIIITQKYFAMCGFQGFEAWTEYRRTGYPNFLVPSKASLLGGTLMPQRFVYADSEATTNQNYPGTVAVTVPVWWQTTK